MALIRLENICKTYNLGEIAIPVLSGISLSIERGEMVALMGSSGSGKTTLLNILGCLDRSTAGRYWLDGQEASQLAPNQRALLRTEKLGFVFQSFNLLSRTSALENVELPLFYTRHHMSTREVRERGEHVLKIVGLSGRADHHPSQLSGGQQQRVAIARALINNPEVLFADEATGNLDSRTSLEIMGVFQKLNEQGITIIMVTHELDIARYAKRNIIMRDGRVLSDEQVAVRLNTEEEMGKLVEAEKAVQLSS